MSSTPLLASVLSGLVAVLAYLLYHYASLAKTKPSPLSLTHGTVISVSKSSKHEFSKDPVESITLLARLGIQGDSHLGVDVQHLFRRVGNPPYPPNLRQVHLIQSELFEEFQVKDETGGSYEVKPGDLGENITTRGLDVLGLSEGTRLRFVNPGEETRGKYGERDVATVRITGLRNPCWQISKFKEGLQERCLVRDEQRKIVGRKAGIMGVVEVGGIIKKGALILAEAPEVFKALDQV